VLGLLRFVLALLVVIAHLTSGDQFFSHWGFFAVNGFYLVSGYLMTFVLNETYQFKFSSYALNRILRLFPIYYLVAIGSLLVILLVPNPSDYHVAWEIKLRTWDVLGNVLVFPFEFYDASFRVVPPMWSVGVEIINYFLLWLIVAKNRKIAFSVMIIAIVYHIASYMGGMDWRARYFPSYAALLPFSLGACIYFSRDFMGKVSFVTIQRISIVAFIIWIVNLFLCGFLNWRFFTFFFYMNLFALLVFVSCIVTSPFDKWCVRSGRAWGDLAYPVFLTHSIVGFMMSLLFLNGEKGLLLVLLSLIPILVLSFVLTSISDRWLEPLRNRVRNGTLKA
jgi:peptidoglycan/LPS O-acetylase OafA/YrhL